MEAIEQINCSFYKKRSIFSTFNLLNTLLSETWIRIWDPDPLELMNMDQNLGKKVVDPISLGGKYLCDAVVYRTGLQRN
jgi:hypothetical protein